MYMVGYTTNHFAIEVFNYFVFSKRGSDSKLYSVNYLEPLRKMLSDVNYTVDTWYCLSKTTLLSKANKKIEIQMH